MESRHGPFVEFLKACAGWTLCGLIGWGITCVRLNGERKRTGHQKTTSELRSEEKTKLLLQSANSLLLKDEEEDYKQWCKDGDLHFLYNTGRYTPEQHKKFRNRRYHESIGLISN